MPPPNRSFAPPSPEPLSSNLDCAFPPFPTSKPAPNKALLGSSYGSLNESNPMYAPRSPRTVGAGPLLQRMNTIAPGPFDPNMQNGSAEVGKGHRRQATAGSLKDVTMSSSEVGNTIQRPSTAGVGHRRTSTSSSGASKAAGFSVPHLPRQNGYGGFGPPQKGDETPREMLGAENRSNTFPLNNTQAPIRRPSEPNPKMRRPSNSNERSNSGSPPRARNGSVGPDLTRKLPPRGASLIRSRMDYRLGDAPPVPPNVNLAAEFGIGNPYHTPSESQSSSLSGYSEHSKASSRSSPPLSTVGHRRPSETTKVDGLMADIESEMGGMQKRAKTPSPSREPKEYARAPSRQHGDGSLLSTESPMDPAMQTGRLSPKPTQAPQRPPLASRPSTSRSICKGCSEPIRGKSVSSADGRLIGKYHKHCFICATCHEPFSTSTFYVHNNSPYCERHYHKVNGSVCRTCDKGIEGQYLESEDKKEKFHPSCLACADCKRVLKNDYFEMNGKVYCERDAFRRAQQGRYLGPGIGKGVGTNKMERRTTRLMMM
jgi:hypothetical protein